jgi:phenylalanyl-tRNA synthetase beta chain
VSIRKTEKMHGLNTDASFRFERGTDPRMTDYVLKRTAVLIQQLAGGQISMEVFDSNPSYGTSTVVEFDYDRCNKLIGTTISQEKVDQILESLDIKVVSKSGNVASLEIPTYRVDVTREADVVEEVLRIYGFNNVPNPEKLNSSIAKFTKPDLEKIQNVCSELLVGFGCNEILNNSLTKSEYVEKHGGVVMSLDTSVQMLNPLSQDLDVMRQSLIFNALETVSHNQNRQNSNVKFFEFGKTYNRYESGFSENKRLLIAVSGLKESESWNASKDVSSYFTMKGIVEGVLERLGLKALAKYKGIKKSILEDGTQVYVLKNKVGEIGWASNAAKKEFGIKNDVFIADLDWDAIIDSLKFTKIKFSELPKTFAVRRDFSLLLDKEISFSQIEEIGYSSDKKILKDIGLFDVYEGKGLKEGTKSYAVSFHFQDAENTLKDKQVDYVMEKIRTRLENDLKAELR